VCLNPMWTREKLDGCNGRIRNRHNQRPIDILPPNSPSSDPGSDDEKVRAALRRAEAESLVAASGDVVDGESGCSDSFESADRADEACRG